MLTLQGPTLNAITNNQLSIIIVYPGQIMQRSFKSSCNLASLKEPKLKGLEGRKTKICLLINMS